MPGRPLVQRASFALLSLAAAAFAATFAAPSRAQVAVPYYSPGEFVAALQVRAQAPFASQFAESATHLVESVGALCEAAGDRTARRPAAGAPGDSEDAEHADASRDRQPRFGRLTHGRRQKDDRQCEREKRRAHVVS